MYFFDIDGRALDDPFVILMLERFGSYAEKSPSGSGIHVLGNCNDEALPFVYDEKKKRYTVAQEFYQKIHITISNYTSVTQLIDMQPLQVMQSMTLILQMNDKTALALRKMKDSAGNYLWNNSNDTILGKQVLISEFMPDIESGTKSIAFGDFSYYWVIGRKPVSVRTLVEKFTFYDQIGYLAIEFLDAKHYTSCM